MTPPPTSYAGQLLAWFSQLGLFSQAGVVTAAVVFVGFMIYMLTSQKTPSCRRCRSTRVERIVPRNELDTLVLYHCRSCEHERQSGTTLI